MLNWIKYLLVGILVSFFYFPFEFSLLPGINTKMMLAVLGIVSIGYKSIRKKSLDAPEGVVLLFLLAGIVSVIGVVSIVYNGTFDSAYATYFVSMSVWLSAAYFICSLIKSAHGIVNIRILSYYVIAVCVTQCALAVLINTIPQLKLIVDTYIQQDQDFLNRVERLYGIGASLDTAGTRFSVCLILIGYLLRKKDSSSKTEIRLLVISFIIIFVLGNVIARTTSVGAIIALVYMIMTGSYFSVISMSKHKVLSSFAFYIAISVVISTALYNSSPDFRRMVRFGFEGFFSLAEKGRWEVSSNDKLSSMVVFPDNTKTWIIGDGYFENPRNDAHYVGDSTREGYYMGTDIGYLRFIFYFGVIGLISFSLFLLYAAKLSGQLLREDKILPYLILLLGFIVWFKVATDLFLVLALLICVGYLSEETEKSCQTRLMMKNETHQYRSSRQTNVYGR